MPESEPTHYIVTQIRVVKVSAFRQIDAIICATKAFDDRLYDGTPAGSRILGVVEEKSLEIREDK